MTVQRQDQLTRNPYAWNPAYDSDKPRTRKGVQRLKKGERAQRKKQREARRRFTSLRWGKDGTSRLRFPIGQIPSGYEPYGDDYNREIVDLPWNLS
jgi:hypothetical protein